MPSYLSYLNQMAVLDADDNEIESWITVRGNHIPIKKGQSKEDAVKSFIASKGGNTEKGLYQDALNELDDQIADKEKELENIHLSMTENAEAGYFDIASANMEDIEFVKGQLEELKKKREKLAGSSGTKAPKVTKVDAKKWNSPASDPWKSLYD